MKPCKSCAKEIDDQAVKCPHCQAFQKWSRNPQIYGLLFPLIFIPFIFLPLYASGTLWKKSFADHKAEFQTQRISSAVVDGKMTATYEIRSSSSAKWADISYQILYRDKSGAILSAENEHEYNWVIQPMGTSYISAPLHDVTGTSQLDFVIIDMKEAR